MTEVLIRAGTREAAELARRGLASDQADERWAILLAVAKREQVARAVADDLVEISIQSASWEERWAAVQALPPGSMPHAWFAKVAQKDRNAMVRSAAANKAVGAPAGSQRK